MSDHPDHDHAEVRSRLVGFIELDEDAHIQVEHVYGNDTCAEHGSLTDPGFIGLAVHDETPGEEQQARVLLGPAETALLINRLTRALNLVMELGEELPDLEREVLRHSEPREAG